MGQWHNGNILTAMCPIEVETSETLVVKHRTIVKLIDSVYQMKDAACRIPDFCACFKLLDMSCTSSRLYSSTNVGFNILLFIYISILFGSTS